jgi:hypothetical protein
VPSEQDQARVLGTIKDLYRAQFSDRSSAGRYALAKTLMRSAIEAKGDDVTVFVLLEQTRDVAVEAGDVDTALEAAHRLDQGYAVGPGDSVLHVASALRKLTPPPIMAMHAALASLDAMNTAMAGGEMETASKLASASEVLAGRSANSDVTAAVRQRSADLRAAEDEFAAVSAAQKKLASNPSDPRANLLVGRFRCFQLDDWDSGLRMLAACSDAKLKTLAMLDQSDPSDARTLLQIADGWDALARSAHGLAHDHVVARALEYYLRASAIGTGFEKVRADRGIKSGLAFTRPWEPGIIAVSASDKGLDIGMPNRRVGAEFFIQLDIKTTAKSDAIVLSKRHDTNEGCLTVYLKPDGRAGVAADADFYRVDLIGDAVVNDGKWHTITVEKLGPAVRLLVDQTIQGEINTRPEFNSAGPWMVGWENVWQRGNLDAEIRHLWIAGWR